MHYVMLEDLYDKFGGKFRFSVLLQKRVKQLVGGDRPLVQITEKDRKNLILISIMEAREGKIWLQDAVPGEEPKLVTAASAAPATA